MKDAFLKDPVTPGPVRNTRLLQEEFKHGHGLGQPGQRQLHEVLARTLLENLPEESVWHRWKPTGTSH